MTEKKHKESGTFGTIKWTQTSGETSTSNYWVDASKSMHKFGQTVKEAFSEQKLVQCRCGEIIEKDKALEGRYCNTICKYDLENVDEDDDEETEQKGE